jgi:serine protease SohB
MKNPLNLFKSAPKVAVIRLNGAIGTGRNALTDAALAPLIEKAFAKGKPKAVALQINSPGGSPTQSALIAARIRRLAAEKERPVFAFVEDVAASGGYWLATAADEIFADDNSILGSIGVISGGFGFHELIKAHGIERRVHTAGESKSMMDPFRPEKPEDVARLEKVLEQIHQNFKAQVRGRRGDKLKGDNLFTGEIWIGQAAVENGLIDGIGHMVPVMKARFGDEVQFKIYGPKKGLLSRFGATILAQIEERSLWARFGL